MAYDAKVRDQIFNLKKKRKEDIFYWPIDFFFFFLESG